MSETFKGKQIPKEQKRKISETLRGRHPSEETRRKMSEALKERIPWIKGKKHSNETKRKMSQTRKGMKNSNWKGGITPTLLLLRNSLKYKEWRQSCFIRDNFTCQKCGVIRGNIEVHHKKSFTKLVKEATGYMPLFSIYYACILYVPMWDINNGITLCKKCHKKKRKG